MDNGTAAAVAPALVGSTGKDRRTSSSSTASGSSSKKQQRLRQSGIKSLVEYTSEVSSEEFSGPEDGEVDSEGGRDTPPASQPHRVQRDLVAPAAPRTPPLVANASPINDDEDIDLGEETIVQLNAAAGSFIKEQQLIILNLQVSRTRTTLRNL